MGSLCSAGNTGPALSTDEFGAGDLGTVREVYRVGSPKAPEGVTDETFTSSVAAAKSMTLLQRRDAGCVSIDPHTVYGAAVALPQIARTAGWSLKYTGFVVKGYMCLTLNLLLQGFLLYMLSTEERVISKFSGRMNLCDFGASMYPCADGQNCIGPGGTEITPERLYSWDVWSTRVFIRDSLKRMLPDKAAEIDEQVDPGEYGFESYYCRLTCCFIFVLGLWPELMSSSDLFNLLYRVPTGAMPWMSYKRTPGERDGSVTFQVNGMPLHWKLINLVLVFFPKVYIWFLAADIGTVFLLEASTIEDMIIKTYALNFILGMGEAMFCALMPTMIKEMLQNVEHCVLFDHPDVTADTDRAALQRHARETTWGLKSSELCAELAPPRFILMVVICSFFICKYYSEKCSSSPDGGMVSNPIRMPKSSRMSLVSFFFGPLPNAFSVDVDEDTTLWEMPPR